MITPKIPKNEQDRLNVLKSYEILHTLPEVDYDEITQIASLICDTPISLIAFVDDDEIFFKSHHGFDISVSPRETSFCGHLINNSKDLFIVNDASKDERFYDNPLVTGDSSVSFYAGIPLISPEGFVIGSLCIIDHEPNELSEEQRKSLKALANQVMKLLELRKKNKKLTESLEKEKELGELKSLFVSTASHQFRTPLAIIQSNAELLMMISENSEIELKSKLKKSTERIRNEVNRMTALMDDILVLGKINSGKIQVDKKRIDVLTLCIELCEQHSTIQHDGRAINFSFSGTPTEIVLNPVLISHALNNLISNAFKYSLTDNPKLHLDYKKEALEITLSDQGIGISKNDIPYLFQTFYRGENVRNISGTGLGLSITKEYIELNNGTIKVQSELNKGTIFTIILKY